MINQQALGVASYFSPSWIGTSGLSFQHLWPSPFLCSCLWPCPCPGAAMQPTGCLRKIVRIKVVCQKKMKHRLVCIYMIYHIIYIWYIYHIYIIYIYDIWYIYIYNYLLVFTIYIYSITYIYNYIYTVRVSLTPKRITNQARGVLAQPSERTQQRCLRRPRSLPVPADQLDWHSHSIKMLSKAF